MKKILWKERWKGERRRGEGRRGEGRRENGSKNEEKRKEEGLMKRKEINKSTLLDVAVCTYWEIYNVIER